MKRVLLSVLALGLCISVQGKSDSQESGHTSIPAIEMQAVRFADWDRLLEAFKGRITVVDLWASWCSPCLERFPHMVELHHEYEPKGVRFVSLNFDEQGDEESLQWANDFLTRVDAVFPNYHMDENMTEAFERLDLLGLPVVVIYDADGKEAYRLTGDNPSSQFTEQDVEDAIRSMVMP